MKTSDLSLLNPRLAALALVVTALGLAAPASPAGNPKGTVTLDDARLDEFTVERESLFDVTPPARRITLDDAKADPGAAQRAGLWEVTKKGPARKVTLDDAKADPDAAVRAGLWDVEWARKTPAGK